MAIREPPCRSSNAVGTIPHLTRQAKNDRVLEQKAKGRAQFRVVDTGEANVPAPIAPTEEKSSSSLTLDEEFPYNRAEKPNLSIGSDAEIAQRVVDYVQAIKGRLVYTETAFYTFHKTAWQELHETKLRRIIARWDGATYTKPGSKNPSQVQINNNRLKSVLAMVADITNAPGFFDDKADGINVANGFLRFGHDGTPELMAHSPEHKCRHTLKAKWNGRPLDLIPEGTNLHKLMHGCFKGQKNTQGMINLVTEVFGIAAAGRIRQIAAPKAVILHGMTAENGKSQILELGESVLPADSVSHVAPANMGNEKYAVKLAGKLLNTAKRIDSGGNRERRIQASGYERAFASPRPLQVHNRSAVRRATRLFNKRAALVSRRLRSGRYTNLR